jgi:hypothetical protein
MAKEIGIVWMLLVNPLTVALAAAGGVGVCAAAGWNWHGHEMLIAGGLLFAAAELAMVPLILAGKADQLAISQAALGATMVHLFVAAASMFAMKNSTAFHSWLVTFYGATMISVVVAAVRAVRSAPVTNVGSTKA